MHIRGSQNAHFFDGGLKRAVFLETSANLNVHKFMLQWMLYRHHPLEATAVWVSSRQLLLIYHQITGRFGCYRTKSDGRWHQFQQTNLDTFDFCNAATDCSPFARASVKLSACQRRPSGVADWRWLNCIHLDIPIALIYAVDRLLERHRVSPTLFVPKAFRGFPGAFLTVLQRRKAQDPNLF